MALSAGTESASARVKHSCQRKCLYARLTATEFRVWRTTDHNIGIAPNKFDCLVFFQELARTSLHPTITNSSIAQMATFNRERPHGVVSI
jgi:hypothetical protein